MALNKKKVIAAAVIAANVLFPFVAGAAEPPRRAIPGQRTATANICSRIVSNASAVGDRFADLQLKLNEKQQDISQRLKERRDERTAKVAEIRGAATDRLEDRFKKLEDRAATDAQKAAVVQFQRDVQTAVAARKAGIDKAMQDFHKGLEDARVGRKNVVAAAVAKFTATVRAAVQKAKTDCASATADEAAIKQALEDAIKAAKTKLQEDLKSVQRVGEQIEALNEARKAAFKKAHDDFRTAIEAAVKRLRETLPAQSAGANSEDENEVEQ